MSLLSVANLTHSFGTHVILDGVNLTLESGEHVGLVGRNGCGKSTLLKLIAGIDNLKADSGQVQLLRGATAGYLRQDPDLDPNRTLREEAGHAFIELERLHQKLDELSTAMQTAQGDELDRILKQYEKVEHDMEVGGGYAVDHKIDATLHGLGLGDETFGVKVSGLSGGQKGRLALAKLLLTEPDLLLLDEPTNHLDINGRQWLEEYLATYRGAVLIISHDRWLLDRCVSRIYELDQGRMEDYPGNYRKYRQLRKERIEFRIREYDKQKDRIQKEQQYIDRYRAGQRARQAAGREKRLERYVRDEKLERPIDLDTMDLRFRAATRSGDLILDAESIGKSYDDKTLFHDLSLRLMRGTRIGIIGPNGCGKTTLINVLLGRLQPDTGVCRLGASVTVGYYNQSHAGLNLQETVVDHLRRVTDSEQNARDLAGAFLFSGLEQDKVLGVLSGGERARTLLAGLVAGGHNMLVLDEPTNHLDIPSAERLEEALVAYAADQKGFGMNVSGGGSLIIITHDRMLLDRVVDQLLIFDGNGNVRHFLGTYSDYAATLGHGATPESETAVATGSAATKAKGPEKSATTAASKPEPRKSDKDSGRSGGTGGTGGGGGDGKGGKGGRKGSSTGQMSQAKLESRIAELEARREAIDKQLCDVQVYRDREKTRRLTEERATIERELNELESEWLGRAG